MFKSFVYFEGHTSTVVSVAIVEHLGFVISYSEEAIIKVWHISDYKCIDTIDLNFQCLENRAPEHGSFPLSYFPSLNCYVFTCNDYMAELKVRCSQKSTRRLYMKLLSFGLENHLSIVDLPNSLRAVV